MKTKKTLKIIFLCILMLLFVFAYAQAKITGNTCSDCHTMHNSQNATHMKLDDTTTAGISGGQCTDCHADTRSVLLRFDCLGCHAKELNTNNNITSDGWPQIALNMGGAPTSIPFLAGGNYKYVFVDNENGHNVHGFGNGPIPPGDLGNNPPGYDSNYDPSTGKYQPSTLSNQIMCAGQNGCHGNRNQLRPYLAMKNTHHADDSMLKFGSIDEGQQGSGSGVATDYTTAGKSYRFLYNVHGGEDSDWQASLSATDHNEYKGAQFSGRGQTQGWTDVTTISDLCAECHGKFHAGGLSGDSGIGTSSPWLRHPTDVVLPNSGEYSAYTAYSTVAPVARPVINNNSPSSVVIPGDTTTYQGAIVMCLSCHRAHASEFPDILRWDYSTMLAGDNSKSGGCFTCHTQKNTNNP